MQGYIPQYILERGDSARAYRRRSSTISRTSNSSTNPSPLALGDSYYGNLLSPAALPAHESSSSGNAHHSEHGPSDDVALTNGNNGFTTYRIDGESKSLLSHATTVSGSTGANAATGDDIEPQNGRFGLARPKLVHF